MTINMIKLSPSLIPSSKQRLHRHPFPVGISVATPSTNDVDVDTSVPSDGTATLMECEWNFH